ncbi:MAG: DUF302 domain-containing protein [Dehalococcoidia bacterium]|jgi:uncharacterized protein (DUF302 family)
MQPVLCFHVEGRLLEAEAAVRAALLEEGFGILTEVDVTATLQNKLGIATKPYKILGACNPKIAHRALEADPRVGAFLPCGLALYEEEDGKTTVCLQDPALIAETFHTEGLAEAAAEARERLEAALHRVGSAA